jgi:hypothetical protein
LRGQVREWSKGLRTRALAKDDSLITEFITVVAMDYSLANEFVKVIAKGLLT